MDFTDFTTEATLIKYTFNARQYFLANSLYIIIICVFVLLCILAPVVKDADLLTMNNVLNILQAASPRMFLALGVSGLIRPVGSDLLPHHSRCGYQPPVRLLRYYHSCSCYHRLPEIRPDEVSGTTARLSGFR